MKTKMLKKLRNRFSDRELILSEVERIRRRAERVKTVALAVLFMFVLLLCMVNWDEVIDRIFF